MIIERIELEHVGPFNKRVMIGPLDPGLSVLSANNEAGKSTVVKATTRALFDRHMCKSDEIKGLQPLGTSLAPAITVVFERGEEKYRVEKVFLESPRSKVSQWNRDDWQLKAEGDAADSLLQQILLSEQPGRGATKPEHWGLFQYLWARQGEPAVWPSWQGEAGKLVQSRLIKIQLDPLIETLKNNLAAEYSQIFTDQGRPKTRGPLDIADKELAALQAKRAEIQARRQSVESAHTRFQEVTLRLAQLENEATTARQTAAEIAEQARQAELLLREVETRQGELNVATEKLQTVVKDIEIVNMARRTIHGLTADITSSDKSHQQHNDHEKELVKQHRATDKDLEEETRKRTKLQDGLDRTQALLKYRGALDALTKLKEQLKKSKAFAAEVDLVEREQGKLPSLTPQKLRKLESLEQEINTLTAQIEAVGLSVEITPTKATDIEVTDASKKADISIKAGQTEMLRSGQSLDLKLKSWGRISVRSGSTELRNIEEQRTNKVSQLDEALAELGVKNVAAAGALMENLRDLASRLRDAQRDLTAALGDFEDIKQLGIEINVEDARLSNVEAAIKIAPAEKNASVTDLEARQEELRSGFKEKDRQVQTLNTTSKDVAGKLTDCRNSRNAVTQELARFQERLRAAKSRIEEIEGRYSEGMDSAKVKAQQEFTKAEARLTTTRASLPPEAEKLPERNRRAARAAQETAQELERTKEERDKLVGELKTRGSEGIYSQETKLLEKISQLTRELEGARRRGWAARLLHDLLERRKQVATRSVLTPMQDRLSGTFAELTGDTSRKVFLDENLQIRGVGRNEQELLAFDLLSQGAKEQLLLALRLAVASALSDGERQLLILDDVLVNTDPVRQQRVLDLLQSAADHLQILVLTCHVDRYRGLGQTLKIEGPVAT